MRSHAPTRLFVALALGASLSFGGAVRAQFVDGDKIVPIADPQSELKHPLVAADRRFAADQAVESASEVSLAHVALAHSTDAAVRALARRVLANNAALSYDLDILATRKGVVLPGQLSLDARLRNAELRRLQGDAFDRGWLEEMVASVDHQVQRLRDAREHSRDLAVRVFAAANLARLAPVQRALDDALDPVD
jgi:predicted outer membrane protein